MECYYRHPGTWTKTCIFEEICTNKKEVYVRIYSAWNGNTFHFRHIKISYWRQGGIIEEHAKRCRTQ